MRSSSAGGAVGGSGAELSGALTGALSARDGLPHITPEVQAAAEAITGHGLLQAGHSPQTELDRLVEDHGSESVVAAFGEVSNGGRLSWPQLVYRTRDHLEPLREERLTAKERKEAEREAARAWMLEGYVPKEGA